jgi:hypothetical protein
LGRRRDGKKDVKVRVKCGRDLVRRIEKLALLSQ